MPISSAAHTPLAACFITGHLAWSTCITAHDRLLAQALAILQGNWQLAEQLFQQLEAEAGTAEPAETSPQTASPSLYNAYAVDWASSQPTQADMNTSWEPQQAAINISHLAASAVVPINTGVSMAEADDRRLSSGSFGDMPTHLAEQVCGNLIGGSKIKSDYCKRLRNLELPWTLHIC